MNLKIKEIFYSLQGEGSRTGEASIFIRLSDCNKNCWFCDTDWSTGDMWKIEDILQYIKKYPAKWIVWTGGEPTLQLTHEILEQFFIAGYLQAIETNGTRPVPQIIDYITCSPKVGIDILKKNFPDGVNEFRYPIGVLESTIPDIDSLPKADHYFVSPIFLGEKKRRFKMDEENIAIAINFVKDNPEWKLSLQTHKILRIR